MLDETNIDFYGEIANKEQKLEIAKRIASKVKDGDVIGFGSGTTSYLTICEIANKSAYSPADIH